MTDENTIQLTEIQRLEQARDGYVRTIEGVELQIENLKKGAAMFAREAQEVDKQLRHLRFVEGMARFDEHDWKALLGNAYSKNREDSNATRDALRSVMPCEYYWGAGCWADTDQRVVGIKVYRNDPQNVKDWAVFVERMLPFIELSVVNQYDAEPTKAKRFSVDVRSDARFYLQFDPSGSVWSLGTQRSRFDVRKTFLTAEEAIQYIADNCGHEGESYLKED